MEEENNNNVQAIIKSEDIKSLIYTIRGNQVMLDSDVARLYHYKTKRVNETMKRNKLRFPENFCFQLNEDEIKNLRSQFATSNIDEINQGGRRYLPYVYTEQGIAMLSGLLRNDVAIQVSINIMNAFVELRKIIANNGLLSIQMIEVKGKLLEHDKKFEEVFNQLQKNNEKIKEKIFFQGQIWDSYNLIIEIIKTAQKKIVIIDNYIDDSILQMLSKKKDNVEVILLTSKTSNITDLDVQKFNKQYPNLLVLKTNKFHDRFIIIDNKELYHCGASLKDLGKKCFAINKMEDVNFISNLLNAK